MSKPPPYWDKFPCETCGLGRCYCTEGWKHNLQCCKDCKHPPQTWTEEEIEDMWSRDVRPRPAYTYPGGRAPRPAGAPDWILRKGETAAEWKEKHR